MHLYFFFSFKKKKRANQLTSSADILTCNLSLHSGQPITPWNKYRIKDHNLTFHVQKLLQSYDQRAVNYEHHYPELMQPILAKKKKATNRSFKNVEIPISTQPLIQKKKKSCTVSWKHIHPNVIDYYKWEEPFILGETSRLCLI